MDRSLRSDEGWILVTSIIMLTLMVSIALASYAFVDTGQRRALDQRQRESSLNVTEGVLYSQGFALSQRWPGNATAGAAMPATCTQTEQEAALQQFCPTPGTLAAANGSAASANFANVDALASVSWTTRVRDNGGPLATAYIAGSPAEQTQTGNHVKTGAAYSCPGPCKWDANGDRQLWVEARGIVRGKPRNVVALLKREQFAESFPRNGVVAGSFETSNQGNKTIIDSSGSQVVVRCTSTSADCTDYNADKNQVLPSTIVRDANYPPAMSDAQLARFKTAAQSASPPTYYTSCPATYTGAVVYVDVPATTVCGDSNNAIYNSAQSPGIIIMPRGAMGVLKGSYHGILYLRNEQNSSGTVLELGANSEVFGGVAIDGPGHLIVGQASGNLATITFVDNVFNSLSSFGTTGLVQNTWRELPVS